MVTDYRCPNSVTGMHDAERRRDGRCSWCGKKLLPWVRLAPPPEDDEKDQAYRYHWDPDFGSGKDDVF